MLWSTRFGGSEDDQGVSVAIDSKDCIIVTGLTYSSDFPVVKRSESYNFGSDAFVTKFKITGEMLWSRCLGGHGNDQGVSVAIDSNDNIFIIGKTFSSDFPIIDGFNETYGGSGDAFVTKLDSTGEIIWSTFLGGYSEDWGTAVAIDFQDSIILTGYTESLEFPDLPRETYFADKDSFVTKLDSNGNLVWSRYLSGTNYDYAKSIAINSVDNIIVAGYTYSDDFPTQNAFNATYNGGGDVFITTLNSSGNIVWSSFFGSSGWECCESLCIDSSNNIIITGITSEASFPVNNGFDEIYNGYSDAFITKLDNFGEILYSTFLGSTDYDSGQSVAVDSSDDVFVTGFSFSSNFPVQNSLPEEFSGANTHNSDVFIGKIMKVNVLVDHDDDGLSTSEEIVLGTNPFVTDTDFDGLSDIDEVNTYGTNPLLADTDGDGYSDGEEVEAGSDPLNYQFYPSETSTGRKIFVGSFLLVLSTFSLCALIYQMKTTK
ncbi:MAG: SBBP repeat-containing protein [Candidatus Heimdallarchaeota archaeon]|nr:SBBP repeat-containing protein [Candidatus Heimdallarchaeota archaeon]MCK5048185.1 SBBP repeat-containing protein [Candidatus Heimdallarchaeota archaeon]